MSIVLPDVPFAALAVAIDSLADDLERSAHGLFNAATPPETDAMRRRLALEDARVMLARAAAEFLIDLHRAGPAARRALSGLKVPS